MPHSSSSDDEFPQEPYDISDPSRPNRNNPQSKDDHREWLKERQSKGKERFNRKQRSARKRVG